MLKLVMKTTLMVGCLAALTAANGDGGKWISLSDGKTLNGWKAEGNANWSVQDGAIVGRQGPGGAGGDLFTEKQWADFELEAEWSMRWPGNSGIWFRWSGPKTGCQADIGRDMAAFPGVLSGSVYCMGKAFIAENRDPTTVENSGWNRVRIRVVGDHIEIEQNGKRVVQVQESTLLGSGSIGIQVHRGKEFEGMEVRVRKIRIRSLERAGN